MHEETSNSRHDGKSETLMRNTIMRKYDPDIHPETIKMAEYIGAIIAAGSVHAANEEFCSPIRCRKRHNNRRCTGRIKIAQRTDTIDWSCTECETSGVITGWRGDDCDMSEFAAGSTTAGMLELRLSEDEYKALQSVLMYTGGQEAIIAGAVWTGEEVLLRASYTDFDMLAGNLAFEVNHSPNTRRQMVLNDVCDWIEMLLRRANRQQ